MDKFIVKRTGRGDGYKPIMVEVSTHEKLMQVKEDTGVPIGRLIAQMVDFCAERLTIEDE